MFHKLIDTNYAGKIDLYFGIRHEKDMLEAELLRDFASKFKDFQMKIYVSKPETFDLGTHGRVTVELVHDVDRTARYYACGHPSMVEEVESKLVEFGVPLEEIIVEEFTHSGN